MAKRLRRAAQIVLLCIAALTTLGASSSRFDRLGHDMICTCSCGQILLECNHVGCPVSPVMIDELHSQLAIVGNPDTVIFRWFAAKYGSIVLASPLRGGFDTVAWVAPIAVLLLATVGTFLLIFYWTRRNARIIISAPAALPATPEAAALRDRIRHETQY